MFRYLVMMLLLSGGIVHAERFKCVCVDRTAVIPACGMCGTESGTMSTTPDGVECYCPSGLKMKDVSCAEACKLKGSDWTGEFRKF